MIAPISSLRRASLPAILAAGLFSAGSAHAQMISPAAGTWASKNNVVSLAPGSSLSVANFKTEVEAAFTAGTGGTINFDAVANAVQYTSISSSFNGGSSTMIFTVSGGTVSNNINTGTDATNASSGSFFLGFQDNTGNTQVYTFTPSEPLSVLGLVSISRGQVRNPVITVNLANSTSVVLTDEIGGTADNTLFNYKSVGASTNIVSFSIAMPNGFARFDDLGFVTASAIPEPGAYAAIAGLGMLAFAGFRRRSIKR